MKNFSILLVIRECKSILQCNTTSHTLGWLESNGWKITIVDEDTENSHHGWKRKTEQPLWKTVWRSLRILNTVTVGLNNSTPRYTPKRNENVYSYKACTWTFIEALFIAHISKVETLKCPSPDEWMNEMWCSHKIEYYLAKKRNEVLIHATTWMNLENIMVNERSQSHKASYCMITLFLKWQKQANPYRQK